MIRPYNVPGWVYFILGTGLAASLFFSIYSFLMIMSLPEFEGLGIIESGDVSLSYYSSTMMSGCSNKTVGVMSRTFTGTTIIAYGCPTTRNFCSEYVCTGERICEEVLSPGSGCSEDKDCTGEAERCDTASCTCVPDGTRCTMDSQCLDLNATSVCVESFCDVSEGQCKTRYINETMDSCDNDNNCDDDLICRGCMCIPMPEMNVTSCTMDSECTDYAETSSCIEAFCNMTTLSCATRFQDMSFDCDGSCPSGEICTDCVCTTLPSNPECTTASDCLNTTSTSECVDVDCIMGQCQTQFIGNATCDGSCPAGQACQDCQCVNITSTNGFQLIQSGVMSLTGPQTLNTTYELYASGNLRYFVWAQRFGTFSTSNSLLRQNDLIPLEDAPPVTARGLLVVIDNNQAQIGMLIVNDEGDVIVFPNAVSISSTFTMGTELSIFTGFTQWSTTLELI